MYETDDPRSRLATASAAPVPTSTAFGASTYARFYNSAPQLEDATQQTWVSRGQNFVVAYSKAESGAVFERKAQVDEYVLLLPEADTVVTVESGAETNPTRTEHLSTIPDKIPA